MHQGKCSASEISAYAYALQFEQALTSGNSACDACLQTDAETGQHGPIVLVSNAGVKKPYLNFGGCIAHADASSAAGSCGNRYNDYQQCIAAECGACPDFSMHGPTDLACIKEATSGGGRCRATVPGLACTDELQPGAAASACLNAVAMLNAWCGP
jgi:hypothetical protein